MKNVNRLLNESNTDLVHAGTKGSVGFAGAFGAMSINDIMGLVVGILTAIYMLFQIEAAWRKRKKAIQEVEDENA